MLRRLAQVTAYFCLAGFVGLLQLTRPLPPPAPDALWPEEAPGADRIATQLAYRPPRRDDTLLVYLPQGPGQPSLPIVAPVHQGLGTDAWPGLEAGGGAFEDCLLSNCALTREPSPDMGALLSPSCHLRGRKVAVTSRGRHLSPVRIRLPGEGDGGVSPTAPSLDLSRPRKPCVRCLLSGCFPMGK